MGHDRNAAVGQKPDGFAHPFATLEFHSTAAGFLHHHGGVAKGDVGAFFIAAKRHIDHDQRLLRAAHHRLAMHDHQVERHRHRAGHAVHHHAQTVTDQNEIGDLVNNGGGMRVIRGQRDNRLPAFHFCNLRHGIAADLLQLNAHFRTSR